MALYTPEVALMGFQARMGRVLPCAITAADSIKFNYGSDVFEFRLPEDGAPIDYDLRVITHRSRSGTLYVYRRGDMTKNLPIQVKLVSRINYLEFEAFVDRNRGKLITYTDSYGTKMVGTFTGFRAVEEGLQRGYSLDLNFEVA